MCDHPSMTPRWARGYKRWGNRLRIVLSVIAIALLVTNIFLPHLRFLALLASILALLWTIIDALFGESVRKAEVLRKAMRRQIFEVLRFIEELSRTQQVPIRLSWCGVKVWRVGHNGLRSRKLEKPLNLVAKSPLHRPVMSSGIRWRIGKGVMGLALTTNRPAAVFIDDLWQSVPTGTSKQHWERIEDQRINMNLTHDEFIRLDQGGGSSARGPWINAVPYFSDGVPRTVAVLDMDPEDARKLGFDRPERQDTIGQISQMLAECARIAVGRESTGEVDSL